MRVLILGSDGFLGRQFCRHLIHASSFEVFCCGRKGSARRPNVLVYDLTDLESVRNLIIKVRPDVVVNLAGVTVGDPLSLYLANVVVPANLADAILSHHRRCRLIHIGSAAEYGRAEFPLIDEGAECRPISLYGHSKLAATNLLLFERVQRGLSVVVLRPFNIVAEVNSPRQVIGAFVEKVLQQKHAGTRQPIRMGYLGAVRDFFCVEDLFLLMVCLIEDFRHDIDVINVCSGKGCVTREVISYLANRMGGVEFKEQSDLLKSKVEDRVVGNPARFLAVTGLQRPTPLNQVLDRIWPASEGARDR